MPSSQHHHNLRQWVIDTDGDGTGVPCEGCGRWLTYKQVTLDRFPIPGRWGGTYRRDNVRAMCRFCNNSCEFDLTDQEVLDYAAENNIAIHQAPSKSLRKKYAAIARQKNAEAQQQPAPLVHTLGEHWGKES